ncbi:hypothetical protein HJG60_011087 [Phyllostomus discolor]|uniref:Uncharacterized protein n=1 Tax=Phyllostomus discolor TaxID=89673 RepID=A0A834A433_9CHIR|nr:hypothetical protein HJG60_011087 [Phyllostomus discolor]
MRLRRSPAAAALADTRDSRRQVTRLEGGRGPSQLLQPCPRGLPGPPTPTPGLGSTGCSSYLSLRHKSPQDPGTWNASFHESSGFGGSRTGDDAGGGHVSAAPMGSGGTRPPARGWAAPPTCGVVAGTREGRSLGPHRAPGAPQQVGGALGPAEAGGQGQSSRCLRTGRGVTSASSGRTCGEGGPEPGGEWEPTAEGGRAEISNKELRWPPGERGTRCDHLPPSVTWARAPGRLCHLPQVSSSDPGGKQNVLTLPVHGPQRRLLTGPVMSPSVSLSPGRCALNEHLWGQEGTCYLKSNLLSGLQTLNRTRVAPRGLGDCVWVGCSILGGLQASPGDPPTLSP